MCSPGTTMRSLTPRFSASTRTRRLRSSGTKYAAERSIDRVAAVIASWYIRAMLSAPPVGELLNIWA